MAEESRERWVLADQHGNYYLLTSEALERARVPESEKPAIEERLRARGDDTTGYLEQSLAMQAALQQQQQATTSFSQTIKTTSSTLLTVVGNFR